MLPMINDSNSLDLIGCIQQSLPLLDRKTLYHQFSLKTNGFPVEFAFHFQLHSILSRMTSPMNWVTISEARNAAGRSNQMLEIFVANNGHKYGFELLGEANKAELLGHYSKQATVYKKELSLTKVLVVNFLQHLPPKRPTWWFHNDDVDITLVHVHIPQNGLVSTIIRSANSADDIVVNLLGIGSHNDVADNVDNVTMNLLVGDTSFMPSSFPKISDFLADVKNEVLLDKGDVRLRLYSNKRKSFVSAATDTLCAFANLQDDDMLVTCGDDKYPVTIQ